MTSEPDTQLPDDHVPTVERQAELQAAFEANVAVGRAPYEQVRIRSRGELLWIMQERGWSGEPDTDGYRQRADLRGAIFSGANLRNAHVADANMSEAQFGNADLAGANVTRADLSDAFLTRVNLRAADLSLANLSGANLQQADLSGANLSGAKLDAATFLYHASFGSRQAGYARLWNVQWDGANLAVVDWSPLQRLGDEESTVATPSPDEQSIAISRAAQAYRGLGDALAGQGLARAGSRFLFRARQLERISLRDFRRSERAQLISNRQLGAWAFYGLLDLVAGYAREPVRTFKSYLVVLLVFGVVFFAMTHTAETHPHMLTWDEAAVLSVSSFHGRGFFPTAITLGDWVGRFAALEAAIGAFIEGVFIATFLRRFLEGKQG